MEGKTLADIGREMEAYRRAGMAGCKFKVGGLTPEDDAERVAAARDAAGDRLRAGRRRQPGLVGRATRSASRGSSSRSTSAGSRSPATGTTTPRMMARVRRATRIPVTAGPVGDHEPRRAPAARRRRGRLRQLRRLGVRRRHRVAPRRRALRARRACRWRTTRSRRSRSICWPRSPHGTYVECFADPERDPVWQTMWANRPPIKDGMMGVSPGPGFGLVLDEAMMRRYRVA